MDGSRDSPRLVLYSLLISNAANLGFAFRSPLVPPNAFMLPENLHQRKSVEACRTPQPVQVVALGAAYCVGLARIVSKAAPTV